MLLATRFGMGSYVMLKPDWIEQNRDDRSPCSKFIASYGVAISIFRPHAATGVGWFVKNFQAHPQSLILTDSIGPTLERIHPDSSMQSGRIAHLLAWDRTAREGRGSTRLVLCPECSTQVKGIDLVYSDFTICRGDTLMSFKKQS
jgi:hypothetical protein